MLLDSGWFWLTIVGCIFVVYSIFYVLDKSFLDKGWTLLEIVRLAFWRTIFPIGSLTLAAIGFDALFDRRLLGMIGLLMAGILALVGAYRLRVAQGLKFRQVSPKSFIRGRLSWRKKWVPQLSVSTLCLRHSLSPCRRGLG